MLRSVLPFAAAAVFAFAGGYGWGWWETAPEAPSAGGDAAAASRAPGYYVEAGQFVVPVLAGGRTLAFVLAQLTVDVADAERAERLRRQLPHVRNALLQGLYGLAGAGAFEGEAPDLDAAARTLRQSLDAALGPDTARAVLFERLLRQPNGRA